MSEIFSKYSNYKGDPELNEFVSHLIKEFKKFISEHYETLCDTDNTAVITIHIPDNAKFNIVDIVSHEKISFFVYEDFYVTYNGYTEIEFKRVLVL